MDIPDNQKIALFLNDKPIGLMTSKIVLTTMGVYNIVWQGVCLDEDVKAGSLGEAMMKMTDIARKKGLWKVRCDNGEGVTTLYTPASEE